MCRRPHSKHCGARVNQRVARVPPVTRTPIHCHPTRAKDRLLGCGRSPGRLLRRSALSRAHRWPATHAISDAMTEREVPLRRGITYARSFGRGRSPSEKPAEGAVSWPQFDPASSDYDQKRGESRACQGDESAGVAPGGVKDKAPPTNVDELHAFPSRCPPRSTPARGAASQPLEQPPEQT